MEICQKTLILQIDATETTFLDITKNLQETISQSGLINGILLVHTLHTTTALKMESVSYSGFFVQENEPHLIHDFDSILTEGADKLIKLLPYFANGRERFLDFVPKQLIDSLLGFLINLLRPTNYFWHNDFKIRTDIAPDEPKNATAHIKATMLRESVSWSFQNTKLNLGIWQSILLADFDPTNRKERKIQVILIGEK